MKPLKYSNMMKDNREFIIEKYKQVKALNFVKSNRENNTGIGKTFEDYIGVVENNIAEPDLAGYEIKSHREESSNYITLFTLAPTFPKRGNSYLYEKYGVQEMPNSKLKKLHTSIFANKYNTYFDKYSFRLLNDREKQEIRIGVYNLGSDILIDNSVGYSYKQIESKLLSKLNNLFYVSAERRYINSDEYFYFNHAEIYTNPSLEKFIQLVEDGTIMFDIRIGSYKSGSKYGKYHDHGSGFRIKESDLKKLYDNYEKVD